ncbi:MAG: replication initiator protein [Microvirus sp.]|nr:MAG: replication initiator protein [Microvirus sp.]
MLSTAPDGRRSFSARRSAAGKACSLPCGRCIGCRLERSRQWAVRIVHESKMHDENSFLTLTYSPENIPKDRSLSVVHCQLFLKRLRSVLYPKKIRFFLCGEYGENLGRPHYHAIIFGYLPSDRVLIKGEGDLALWSSDSLSRIWGHGFVSIGSVSFDSAAYVANYATKKITGALAPNHYKGLRPEFLLMSRRPGIGRPWLDKFASDVYPSDQVIVRGHPTRPPRYYDQLLEASDPAALAILKAKRQAAADKLEEYVLQSGRSVFVSPSCNDRRLKVREVVAKAKFNLKKRSQEKI